ncbi:antA/AntB antirepressor family protein [Eubacterium callanderi]|uniref:antA/AntB antirepressor family protein n=1 Tax=Eubacterium callanderi TaxID=53442 RepID=UPI001AA17433|nr:antA/AntB antirepressor family protein [Eubacterium callanderi]MBO1704229.1 antA/AntB antirepressor family protein [Eubacterium callanderi]
MQDLKIFSKDVIPVYTTDTGAKVVIGRELHEKLGIETPYRKWFPRMCEIGFIENKDYTPDIFVHPQNKQETVIHYITFDMAKHIAMIQRSDIGFEIRQKLMDLEEAVSSGKIKTPSPPPLSSVNMAVKNLMQVYREAGVDPKFTALAVSELYKEKANIPLNPPIEIDEHFYDQTEIAKELGVYSTTGKPHPSAIGAILEKLEVADKDKIKVPYLNNGHPGTNWKYSIAVVEKIKEWVAANGYPSKIQRRNGTNCNVVYKELQEVS